MKTRAVASRSVLITGCSSGIGLAAAQMLRERDWRVVPTARKPVDLERLRGMGFEPLHLEMEDSASVERVARDAIARCDGTLGALVNNAGFGQPGAMEDLSREQMRHQFEVNVFGLQDLTNRVLPTMRRQGYGRIVNVGSILGLFSMPFLGVYSGSKFAVEAFADALRAELSGTGIAVSLVGPGPIATSFRANAAAQTRASLDLEHSVFGVHYRRVLREREERGAYSWRTAAPAAAARKIVHALESVRPRGRYTVTLEAHLVEFGLRLLPRAWLYRLAALSVRNA